MTDRNEDPKPDGAAFDDYFESLGKKAEHLSITEQNANATTATNGNPTEQADSEDDQKVVDEIESLCMNCRKNVKLFPLLSNYANYIRESPACCSLEYPSSARS